MGGVEVGVLGTAVVTTAGARRELGAAKHRALLSILALRRGQRVPTDTIVAALWGERPPAGAAGTLQGYVADLRRVLEPHRAPREAPTVLVTVPGGYSLHLDARSVDAARFEADVRRAALLLDVIPHPLRPVVSGEQRTAVTTARDLLDDALALWRGDPLCDLGSDLELEVERDRLRALRLDAEVLRLTALLALGGHATAVTDLERVARGNPWNERVWGLWAIALAGSGRQAEALACLRQLRTSLSDELGIDPSVELRDLETAIIRQELPRPQEAPPVSSPVEDRAAAEHEDELRTLGDILGLAARNAAQLVHLTGEGGSGKTRLVRQAEELAGDRGFAVARVACGRERRGNDGWAWRQLVAALADVAGRQGDDPLGLMTAVGARTPLLVVVEDVQWADEATLRAVRDLVANRPAGPFVLLLTQRLAPTGSPAMGDLLDTLARAHGVHLPLAGREPERAERVAADPGSPARAAVAECLHGLPPGTLALLGGASLLERTFDADLLAHAADLRLASTRDLLAPATAAGILRAEPGDRYTFRQDAVRDVLASALTPLPRARWHANFARVLEQRSGLDRPDRRTAMARHWRAAGYAFTAQAWRATAKAAQRALADGHPAEAAVLLGEAARAQRWDRTATADDARHLDTLEALVAAVPVGRPPGRASGDGPLRTA